MKGKFIISIVSEDKKGLLNQLTSVFNKRNYEMESLNVSRTDISTIVLITIEAFLPVDEVQNTLFKLERFIEVYKARADAAQENSQRKIGFFSVSKDILTSSYWALIQKYGASITALSENAVLLEKTGTDADILELYNQLDSTYLLGFCKTNLIMEKSMTHIQGLF